MDTTIKPATKEEKFEIMKAQLVKKGKWNEESELHLREVLEVFEAPVVIEEPKEVKKPVSKKSDKKSTKK